MQKHTVKADSHLIMQVLTCYWASRYTRYCTREQEESFALLVKLQYTFFEPVLDLQVLWILPLFERFYSVCKE